MLTAMWRKLRADLKTHRLQLLLITGVLALSAMLLSVSLMLLVSANDPWDETFEATNGPHLWLISLEYDLDFSPLVQDAAVTESTGTIMALAENPLVLEDEQISIFLYAMDQPPPVAHPLVAKGRWLEAENPGEIVLDFSFAKFYNFQVGDQVTVLGVQGNQQLEVVGMAVTAHWFPYDEITRDTTPGVAYISQKTLESLQPDRDAWYSVTGLRVSDPENSKALMDSAFDLFPGKLRMVLDWQYIKENATLANTLNALFMGLFSILGLAAVGMMIFNTIGGQVLSQYREIGLLKAVGFNPAQVTMLYLFEHLMIGLVSSILGILLSFAVGPGLVNSMAENLNTNPPNIYSPAIVMGVLVLVETAVALATILPSWQGGRIDTVQAITVGYRSRHARRSRLGGLAGWLGLPPVLLLGVKDTFTRPVRTLLAIASLLLTVVIAMTAVGAQATTDHLSRNRFYFNGTTADMKLMRNFVPHEVVIDRLLSLPDVEDFYEESILYGQAPGYGDQPLAVRLLEGNFDSFDFPIKEGRMIAAPGEAVMGYAVLALLDVNVGDEVEILIDGNPLRLTIVGRHAENFMLNNVVLTSMDSFRTVDPDIRPTTYYLRLKDPQYAEKLRRDWLDETQGLVNISVIQDNPVASVVQLKNLIISIAVILLFVAAANLMSTSLLGIGERVRDFGIQKTLGLTPVQIAVSVMVGTIFITAIALVIGVTAGLVVMERFIQQVGIAIGAGPDFYVVHWGGISLLIPVLVIVAILSGMLPALRAARLQVTDALRYE